MFDAALKSQIRWLPALLLLVSAPTSADLFSSEKFRVFADFRARAEADRDSRNPSGVERQDRNRLRVRVRLGVRYAPDDHVTFGVRVRSGSDDSQQSPHITIVDFDDNPTGDAHVNADQWFLEGRTERAWGWVGRNSLPLWKQNELFWDDDVTPAGLAGGLAFDVGDDGNLALRAGLVSLPAGMRDFLGKMTFGQIVYSTRIRRTDLTLAAGKLCLDGEPDFPSETLDLLLDGNGSRDYSIWIGNVQAKLPVADRALTLGFDVMHNAEDYSAADPDPFTAANRDETDGHVLSLLYGGGKDRGDWLAGYYYARIETLAVNNSYSQDDWVRWGSNTQTRGSNLKGHELRFVYNLGRRTNLVARLYLVDAVVGLEDGKRFRLDLNRKL